MKVSKVIRVGNSIVCAIPKRYWTSLGLSVGDYCIVSYEGNAILIRRLPIEEVKKIWSGSERHPGRFLQRAGKEQG